MDNTKVIVGYSAEVGEYLGNAMLEVKKNGKSITGYKGKIAFNKGISFWKEVIELSKDRELMQKIENFVSDNKPMTLAELKAENARLLAKIAQQK